MTTPNSLLRLLAALALLLTAGCASTADTADPPRSWGPDAQLSYWLDAWFDGQQPENPESAAADAQPSREEDGERPRETLSPRRVRMGLRSLSLQHPAHVPTLVSNGAVSLALGDHPSAEHWLDAALDLDPGHVDAASLRARLAVDVGNLTGARRVLHRAILLRPDAAELRQAHAGVLYLQGDLEASWSELEAAVRLAGSDARNAYHRGLIKERAGEPNEALALYRLAAQTDPNLERAWQRWQALEALGTLTNEADTSAAP
ncbi:MAG: tetratricopeptide (TPR) repeat protein [Pseudohongiellaceae bacterium]|jgi:tetratricopeptide (TPR) repeat protein